MTGNFSVIACYLNVSISYVNLRRNILLKWKYFLRIFKKKLENLRSNSNEGNFRIL